MTGWRATPAQPSTREWSEAPRLLRVALLIVCLVGAGANLAAAVIYAINFVALVLQ
jgi:hypothetical protein